MKKNAGEVVTTLTLFALGLILLGTFLGTQRAVQQLTFRLVGMASGEKVRLVDPLQISDRGEYFLLSSSVCFTGVTIPSNPGRYWIHTEKRPDGIYSASSVQYIAPQTNRPYCPGGKPWDFTMKINKIDKDYLCRGGLLFTSSSAFAVNERIDLNGNSISPICPPPTPSTSLRASPTPTPTTCSFAAVTSLKETGATGTTPRDMTEINKDSIKWYAMNDKQRAKHGANYNPQTADQNWYGFTGGKITFEANPLNFPLPTNEPTPAYRYEQGDKACVKLFYDHDIYDIDSADPGPATIGATIKDPVTKDEICNLPLACNLNYQYGWVMKKKAPTPTPTPSATPTPTNNPTGPGPTCTITGPGWVDADRSRLRGSAWFTTHKYGDCAAHNNGFWPALSTDCLFNDSGAGPTAANQAITKEPPNLYYKHFTPGDILDLLPTQTFRNQLALDDNELINRIRKAIVDVISKNPSRYSSISMGSLSAGLEGGRDGTTVRSASFWVHPAVEKIISDAITPRERARLVYQPFIEGAVGRSVSLDDVTELYTAALNRCGSGATGGDQSGLGTKKQFGDYTAVVQNWSDGADNGIFSQFRDCNIHVVRTNACTQTTPPTLPTGGGGSACVLRDNDHAETCRPKNARATLFDSKGKQSTHKVTVSWDRMLDATCDFDVYRVDVVEPTDGGKIVCQRRDIPKNENEGEARVSVGCDVVANSSGVDKVLKDFTVGVTYTANVYIQKNLSPACFSKGGHAEFERVPKATDVPPTEQPQPTSFPPGKADRNGNYDAACCAADSDCPTGQKCNIPNGGCRSNQSCNANSQQPVPPPPLPSSPNGNGVATGPCSVENLMKYLPAEMDQTEKLRRARNASCVCKNESGGDPFKDSYVNCLDTYHRGYANEYDVGLFQVEIFRNAPSRCPNNNNGLTRTSTVSCRVSDPGAFNACLDKFHDVNTNINFMYQLSSGMTSWCGHITADGRCSTWGAAALCGLKGT